MKRDFLIILIIFAFLFAIGLIKGLSNEDDWICSGGEWVRHGNPSASMPTAPCGQSGQNDAESVGSDIAVFLPQAGQMVKSPATIEGEVRGTWFFEAVLPIEIRNNAGQKIAVGYVQATDDWMTENFIPFRGEIEFDISATTSANLIFRKANPSDLPENDQEFKVPVILAPSREISVKIYFNNSEMDPEFSCNKVFAVNRRIVRTAGVAQAALKELFAGPTEAEKAEGYFTSINEGVEVQKIVIENGMAKVEFNEALEAGVGGSCRVSAIRAQIEETLKQFLTIDSVVISINGRTEDILQP